MRILAINNDPIVQETLVQMLLLHPKDDVMAAKSPAAALALLDADDQAEFDCFLISANYVLRDNSRLIGDIRARSRGTGRPVLVLSDVHDIDRLQSSDPEHRTTVAAKPVTPQVLHDRLMALTRPAAPPPVTVQMVDFDAPVPLSEVLEVFETDGIVSLDELGAHVAQLPRRRLFGATCFGLAIRDVEMHHAALSPFDFHSMICDVADAIAEEMADRDMLFAYTGDGVFVGVTDARRAPNPMRTMRQLNTRLAEAGLTDGDGIDLEVKLSAGEVRPFTWRTGRAANDIIEAARASAIDACKEHGKLRDQFWFMDRTG